MSKEPDSQNDFHGIPIPEFPEITTKTTPIPLLRHIYAIRNTIFDKILESYSLISILFQFSILWSIPHRTLATRTSNCWNLHEFLALSAKYFRNYVSILLSYIFYL